MTAGYTPTTAQVKDAYVRAMRNAFIASEGEHREEFRRWLAARDAKVAAAVLAQAAAAARAEVLEWIERSYFGGEPQSMQWRHKLAREHFGIAAAALTPTEGNTDDAR
jgi:rubrerythrin